MAGRRWRVRWGRLLGLSLLALPAVELWLLLAVSRAIGGWWTLGLLILGCVLGVVLLRHAGRQARATLTAARTGLQPGVEPTEAADRVVTLLAGLLLLFPGFLSDAAALVLLVLRRPARRALASRLRVVPVRPGSAPPGPVIPGEVVPGEVVPGEVVPGEVVDPS